MAVSVIDAAATSSMHNVGQLVAQGASHTAACAMVVKKAKKKSAAAAPSK